ncbi:MAG: membrane protein insertase YidC [Planctomycetota bacterium]|nr:MAG: membrane protein insertase YidC [Planctomycetota bacterium]
MITAVASTCRERPVDRRFFAWLLLTTSLFFIYLSTRPRVEPQEGEEAAGQAEAQATSDDPLLRGPQATESKDQQDSEPSDQAQEPDSPAADSFPTRIVTLGSMDPNSGYRLLVTLTSRGAGVERAEFVEQKKPGRFRYRALEHDGGYLGYLALGIADEGLLIRAVPPGSPAATATCPHAPAGLAPGDILVAIGDQAVRTLADYDQTLRRTKVGKPIELTVLRPNPAGNSPPRQLVFTATLAEAPLDVIRMRPRPSEQVEGNIQSPCLRTTLASIGATRVPAGQLALPALAPMLDVDWETRPLEVPGGDGVEFALPLDRFLQPTGRPARLELVKRYRLLPAGDGRDGYLLDLETELVNHNEEEVIVALRQEGLSGLTLEGWWYSVKISPYMFSGAGQRDVMYHSQLEGHRLITTRSIVKRAQDYPGQPFSILFSENEPVEARTVRYIGLDSPYFNASILPAETDATTLDQLRQAGAMPLANVKRLKKAQLQAANVGFWFDVQDEVIPPGESRTHRYRVFIGPKDSQVLADHGLERAIEYGWFPWIAKPLSAILHFFHLIVGNYGLSIVLLTVLVRGCMFPLGRKAAINAQKMQELQPELKRINELYKDNMEKRAKAMQELYAKHNFKPLAGCLPMFIQLPIFIGLYRCLSVDISLRQEPLIPGIDWCSNLAGPDMLLDWSGWMPEFIAGRGTGWLGPYFNILPMVTVALFLAQQKLLMPKATDEQTRMTQNMMQVMTIFMGVLFFKVPSGLCIYFITSSMWSLVERQMVKRMLPATPATTPPATTPDKPSPKRPDRKANKGNEPADSRRSKLQELKELLEKPAVRSSTQRKPPKGPPPSKRNRKRRK